MPDLNAVLTGFVAGDNLEVRRTVTGLTDAIASAQLTCKRHRNLTNAEATISKNITTTDAPGVGHVVTAGGPGESGILRFDFLPADTSALNPTQHVYDIEITLDDETIYTVEVGIVSLTAGVTDAPPPTP